MKQPRKLKRAEKELLSKHKLNPENWMFSRIEDGKQVFVHKKSKKERPL